MARDTTMQPLHHDRLLCCSACGALATDVAAQQLGWQGTATEPTSIRCHRCREAPAAAPAVVPKPSRRR
jgi:hypothetical protein